MKPAQAAALIAGYGAGKTMKELAAEFGIDRRTVSTYLHRAEVAVRRGGLDQDQAVEAARLYGAGWSSGKLAERFNVSADNVLKALRSAGVTIQARGGGPAPKVGSPASGPGRRGPVSAPALRGRWRGQMVRRHGGW